MKLLINLCVIVALATVVQSQNYCRQSLCPAGRKHIACNSKRNFASSCPANAKLVDLTSFQKTILHLHNSKRNLIAGGRVAGYQPAVRMATMQWDPELAALAAINVKQCVMRHDKCHNTPRFSKSGQNLAMLTYTGAIKSKSNLFIIRNRVNAWWKEYKNANMNIINYYPSSYSGPAIGHFTVFVRDENPRVGCAASRFTKGKKNRFLIACNYATTNIATKPIYVAGATASRCTTGRNSIYTNLCSTSEVYAGL